MKFIKLLATAYVNGVIRHPHEGVLHLEADEAKRLVEGGLGQDVSDDFGGKAAKDAPTESVTTVTTEAKAPAEPPVPHQSEIAPQAVDDATKPAATKAPASKE